MSSDFYSLSLPVNQSKALCDHLLLIDRTMNSLGLMHESVYIKKRYGIVVLKKVETLMSKKKYTVERGLDCFSFILTHSKVSINIKS
jgi:hypothetical protein